MKNSILSLAALVLLLFTGRTEAQVAWTVSDGVAVGGAFGWTVGVEFTPTRDIQLDALGFYERSGSLNTEAPVGLWRVSDQQLLASVVIPATTGGTIIGNFRYIDLDTHVALDQGVAYRVADGFP